MGNMMIPAAKYTTSIGTLGCKKKPHKDSLRCRILNFEVYTALVVIKLDLCQDYGFVIYPPGISQLLFSYRNQLINQLMGEICSLHTEYGNKIQLQYRPLLLTGLEII